MVGDIEPGLREEISKVGQKNVWIVDENADGFVALAPTIRGLAKENFDLDTKIESYGTADAVLEALNNADTAPDLILVGNLYRSSDNFKQPQAFEQAIEKLSLENKPKVVRIQTAQKAIDYVDLIHNNLLQDEQLAEEPVEAEESNRLAA